jgi:hypothetical protein
MDGYDHLMEKMQLKSFSRREKTEMDTLPMKILSNKLSMQWKLFRSTILMIGTCSSLTMQLPTQNNQQKLWSRGHHHG